MLGSDGRQKRGSTKDPRSRYLQNDLHRENGGEDVISVAEHLSGREISIQRRF